MISSRPRPPSSRTRFLSQIALFDLTWAALSPALAFVVRDGAIFRPETVAIYSLIAICVSIFTFQWFKISAPILSFFSAHDAFKLIQACLTTAALTAVVLFSVTRLEDAPRSIPIIHFFMLAGGLLTKRALHRMAANPNGASSMHRHGRTENVLIIEASRLAWFFSKIIDEFAAGEVRIIAVLDDRPELRNRQLNGYSIVGSPKHLSKIIREYDTHGIEVHKVVLAGHPDKLDPVLLAAIQATCEESGIRMEWLHERFLISPPDEALANDKLTAGSIAQGMNGYYWKIKRLLDIGVAAISIIAVAPLLLGVAVLVFIDVGLPIIFWQQRIGHLGRPIHVYKFRTMRAQYDRQGRVIPLVRRLSSLGRMLRRNRLDEITQLVNVMNGSMSLVGPRPLLPIDQPKNLQHRLRIKPGLTGLAQVNGGKLLSPEEKDALDDWYVQHASVWLDTKIIFRTMWVVVSGDRRNETEIGAALIARDRSRLDESQSARSVNSGAPSEDKGHISAALIES